MPSVNELGEWVMRGLAVAGGAAVGGFGTGFLMQLIARLTVARPLPKPVLNILRVLGAIVAGCLVWMWVFGSGGAGFGFGGGGFGMGGHETGVGGAGRGQNIESAKETLPTNGTDAPAGPEVLRVEVLGDRPDERTHFYRLESGNSRARLTLEELRGRIRERQTQAPPLQKLVILLYLDSPDKDKLQIRELRELALDLKVPFIDIVTLNRKAPQGA
jgi:hypothetical protein